MPLMSYYDRGIVNGMAERVVGLEKLGSHLLSMPSIFDAV